MFVSGKDKMWHRKCTDICEWTK